MIKPILALILFSGLVFGLDCQCPTIEIYQEEEIRLFFGDPLRIFDKAEPLVFRDFVNNNEFGEMEFQVMNPNNFEIEVDVTFGYTGYTGKPATATTTLTIPGKGFGKFESTGWACRTKCRILEDKIDYTITEPFELVPQLTIIEKTNVTCFPKDDGDSCSVASECCGGFCVEGKCNFEDKCYGGDCKCSDEKIQCPDHSRCVSRGYLKVGNKPICSFEECKSLLVNSDGMCAVADGLSCEKDADCLSGQCNIAGTCGAFTGCLDGTKLCDNQCLVPSIEADGKAYSCAWQCESDYGKEGICRNNPRDVWIFWLKFFGILFGIFLVGVGIINIYNKLRIRHNKDEIKKRERHIDSILSKVAKQSQEIEDLKKLLISATSKTEKRETEKKIQQKKEQIQSSVAKTQKIEKEEKKFAQSLKKFDDTKPRKPSFTLDEHGYLRGYIRDIGANIPFQSLLDDHSTLVHRQVAFACIYWWNRKRYPLPFKKYQVHHKDYDKLNNEVDNLKLVTKDEHMAEHGILAQYKLEPTPKRILPKGFSINEVIRKYIS